MWQNLKMWWIQKPLRRLNEKVWKRAEKRGSDSVNVLLPLLSDQDTRVRTRTARTLAKIKDQRALQPLSAALDQAESHEDLIMTYDFATSLEELEPDRKADLKQRTKILFEKIVGRGLASEDILISAFERGIGDLNEQTLDALVKIGSKKAGEPVFRALQKGYAQLRLAEATGDGIFVLLALDHGRWLARMLAALGDPRGDEALEHLNILRNALKRQATGRNLI